MRPRPIADLALEHVRSAIRGSCLPCSHRAVTLEAGDIARRSNVEEAEPAVTKSNDIPTRLSVVSTIDES